MMLDNVHQTNNRSISPLNFIGPYFCELQKNSEFMESFKSSFYISRSPPYLFDTSETRQRSHYNLVIFMQWEDST